MTADHSKPSSTDLKSETIASALHKLWCTLLGVESLSIRDNFFDLGGHSLLAVRLLGTITKRYGVRISMKEVIESEFTIAFLRDRILSELSIDSEA